MCPLPPRATEVRLPAVAWGPRRPHYSFCASIVANESSSAHSFRKQTVKPQKCCTTIRMDVFVRSIFSASLPRVGHGLAQRLENYLYTRWICTQSACTYRHCIQCRRWPSASERRSRKHRRKIGWREMNYGNNKSNLSKKNGMSWIEINFNWIANDIGL